MHFSVGYAQRPNTLTVDVDSLQQGTSAYYNQDLTSRNIAANAHTNYSFHPGAFSLHYGVVAKASLHGIKTGLDGIAPPAEDASLQNDLWYNTYEVALSRYERHDWSGSVNASYHKIPPRTVTTLVLRQQRFRLDAGHHPPDERAVQDAPHHQP